MNKDIKITHQFEINPLACGQAVLAMLSGKTQEEIFRLVGTERETTLKCMKETLKRLGFSVNQTRNEAFSENDLPYIALLSLETPKCWHWSLYCGGKFYDPEYGISENFPPSKRKYFWELNTI